MSRRHGQTTYYIKGEGFLGEEVAREVGTLRTAAFAHSLVVADPQTGEELVLDSNPDQENDPERAFQFSRLFSEEESFKPTVKGLSELGEAMDDTPNLSDHPELPAGFTYVGQFIDHDITFDATDGLPRGRLSVDQIVSGRSPSLDLDSLYGLGPDHEQKNLYEADEVHLRIGHTTGVDNFGVDTTFSLPNDLPRGDNPANPREASIGDPRNDENLAIAQLHLAFLKFHNVVVAQLEPLGLSGKELFVAARRTVTLHYQWIVLYDFLPRILDQTILHKVITRGPTLFKVPPGETPTMPIEFSVAAYRFGHSMIRNQYEWNSIFETAGPGNSPGTLDLLFRFSGLSGDMFGAPTLPTNWVVDWTRLFDFKDVPGFKPNPKLNRTRSIDTALALGLGKLSVSPDTGFKSPKLAVRNLLRGRLLKLPSGQKVARDLKIPVLGPEQISQGPHAAIVKKHKFDTRTPLWYYILKEAEVLGKGQRLGPVGSTIVAETFVGLIKASKYSILSDEHPYWRPHLPSLRPGNFTMVDLLLLVNEINPLGSTGDLQPSSTQPAV